MPKTNEASKSSKREDRVSKAKSLLSPKTVTVSSPDPLLGVGLVVTSDKKEAAKVSETPVVQEQPKGTAKKPTAKELGVAQVKGGRGKVRSENPASLTAPLDLTAAFAEMTAHHVMNADVYSIMREVEKLLGSRWTDPQWGAEKMEPPAEFFARLIKEKVSGKFIPVAPVVQAPKQTAASILKQPEAPKTQAPAVKETPAAPKVSKPKSDGIYGVAATAIMRWCGNVGWTKEQTIKALAAKGWVGSEATVNIQYLAGKKGGDCGGRGPIPSLTDAQVKELEELAGREASVQIEVKPKKK